MVFYKTGVKIAFRSFETRHSERRLALLKKDSAMTNQISRGR
jgi:hypothetical protein